MNELRYRRNGVLGLRANVAPRSALAAVRVRDGCEHEMATAGVDIVLMDPLLPTAVTAFESIDANAALAFGQQIAEHVNVPLFNEVQR